MSGHIPTLILTGASGGIGRAIAEEYAKRGWRLFLQGFRHIDALRVLCEELSSRYGVTATALRADLSDPDAVNGMFSTILREEPSPDVLINCAGIAWFGLVQDMTDADYSRVMETNFGSVFRCCRAILPSMLHRHSGCILNISSMWGSAGSSTEAVYSASKGAIDAFTRALGKELAPSGIRVNAIACGVIDTPMNDILSDNDKAALADDIPLGRFGRPEEIARTAYFLTGPGSSYITGQIIRADGAYL